MALANTYGNASTLLNDIAVVDSSYNVISCSKSIYNGKLFTDFEQDILKQVGIGNYRAI